MSRSLMTTGPALVLTLGGLTACTGWVESYCEKGEVYVRYAEGGADCRGRISTDPRCPDGRVLRDTRPSGKLDCVVDDITAEEDPVAPVGR